MEEITEIVKENSDLETIIKDDVKSTANNSELGGTSDGGGNFDGRRKRSIKDEFTLAKDLLKLNLNDDELEPEVIEETMKNTLYNKCIGMMDDSDDEKSE
jgi:hypothetical protein